MRHGCLSRRRGCLAAAPARLRASGFGCLLLLLPGAAAAQSAVEYGRIWGAPGDSSGGAPERITVGASWLDRAGSAAMLAQDEGLVDDWRGFTLFDARGTAGDDRRFTLRGRLSTDDRMPGSFVFAAVNPDGCRYRIFYHRLTHYDDPTANDPYLADPELRRFRGDPLVRWAMAGIDWSRRVAPGWRLRAGFEHIGQEGDPRLARTRPARRTVPLRRPYGARSQHPDPSRLVRRHARRRPAGARLERGVPE